MGICGMVELEQALRGVSYPAQRWQLLAWADYNVATGQLRDLVWQLPVRSYDNLYEVRDAILDRSDRFPVPVPRAAVDAQPVTTTGPEAGSERTQHYPAVGAASDSNIRRIRA